MDSFPFRSETSENVAWWPCGEDQSAMMWTDTAGYMPSASNFNSDLDGPSTSQGVDWYTGTIIENPHNGCVAPADLEATSLSTGVFDPSFNFPADLDSLDWFTQTPSLTDTESVASPPCDTSWAGSILPPTQLVAEPQADPAASSSAAPATPSPSQAELLWFQQPGQFIGPYFGGDEGVLTPFFDVAGAAAHMPWGCDESIALPLGTADIGAAQNMPPTLAPPTTVLRKRRRGDDEPSGDQVAAENDSGQRKKAKGSMAVGGILEAAGSASRAHQQPTTRILVKSNAKSEAAGRRAGMLASPNAQGVYHQSLPGPSVQRELTGTTAQGQLHREEGREQEAPHAGNVAQRPEVNSAREGKPEDAEGKLYQIPKRLTERQKSLLKATSADWTRGAIQDQKCRLCPGAAFGNWEDFIRHCDSMEAHPLRIAFCEHCGDFFARKDSLVRHRKNRPPECLGITPAEAEAKRCGTVQVHLDFERKLGQCLETDEKIGTPFAQRIKAMYPNSSKRGSREQSRLKGFKSRS